MKNVFKVLGIIALTIVIGFGFAACDDSGSPHTHTWGNDVVTAPTCTIAGYTTQTCSGCKETQQINPTAALGHDWNTETETVREGVQGKKCKGIGCNRIKDLNFTYAIGEDGPGDGKIIYVADGLEGRTLGFIVTGADSFTAYYLEAAPTNQAYVSWSSSYVNVTGATGTAIGRGKANTAAIITAHPGDTVSNNAAKAAVTCTSGGKSDWFLPSKDELNEMYKARSHLGISSSDYFWSSSQCYNNKAWYQRFNSGAWSEYLKILRNDVRAVRAF